MIQSPALLVQPPGPFLDHCREICKSAGSNFTSAFAFLPQRQREAMLALYAFMRHTDDISDEAGDVEEKVTRLDQWEDQLDRAIEGQGGHPVLEAVTWLVRSFGVNPDYFREVIRGVREDLHFVGFADRAQQDAYCYKVASVVGLCCIKIWGAADPAADSPSIATGLAFQRTNILRDLKEDLEKGRCYIPRDLLEHFGVRPEVPRTQVETSAWKRLIEAEVKECRKLYEKGGELFSYLPRPGRAVLLGFSRIYHGLLEKIAADPDAVWQGRIRLTKFRKVMIFARAWRMRVLGF